MSASCFVSGSVSHAKAGNKGQKSPKTRESIDMDPVFRHAFDHLGRMVLRHQSCGGYLDAFEPGMRWFCVATHPGQDFVAAASIARLGRLCFLPLFVEHPAPSQINRPRPPVIAPLFPGYQFVAFNRDRDRWTDIAMARGVKTLFTSPTLRPIPAPAGVVEAIIARAGVDGLIDDQRRVVTAPIPAGAAVTITEGPLAGFEGICARSGPDRVTVLLRLMGETQTTVARSAVRMSA